MTDPIVTHIEKSEGYLKQFNDNVASLKNLHMKYIGSASKSEEQRYMGQIDKVSQHTAQLTQHIQKKIKLLKDQTQSNPEYQIHKSKVCFSAVVLVGFSCRS